MKIGIRVRGSSIPIEGNPDKWTYFIEVILSPTNIEIYEHQGSFDSQEKARAALREKVAETLKVLEKYGNLEGWKNYAREDFMDIPGTKHLEH